MEDTICFVVMDLIRILMYVSTLVWQIIGLSLSLSLSLSVGGHVCGGAWLHALKCPDKIKPQWVG